VTKAAAEASAMRWVRPVEMFALQMPPADLPPARRAEDLRLSLPCP